MYSNNPIADYDAYDLKCEMWLAKRPTCCLCGEHIQDETAFMLGDDIYCENCIEGFRFYIDD